MNNITFDGKEWRGKACGKFLALRSVSHPHQRNWMVLCDAKGLAPVAHFANYRFAREYAELLDDRIAELPVRADLSTGDSWDEEMRVVVSKAATEVLMSGANISEPVRSKCREMSEWLSNKVLGT